MATHNASLPKSHHHRSGASPPNGTPHLSAQQSGADLTATINEDFQHPDHRIPPPSYEGIDNLVVVCGHAIYTPDASSPEFPLYSPYDEENWLLEPYQTSTSETGKPGEHETFLAHIVAGIDAVSSGSLAESTILVFSGGATKSSNTQLSEARSYYHAALAQELAQGHRGGGKAHKLFAKGRIQLEEHATDSYQNLLLSILLFRRITDRYPKHIRIITHAFKTRRFLELHAPAIQWPPKSIQVQGIDPIMSSVEREETTAAEERNGFAAWAQDPLGTGHDLQAKRKQRGWDDSIINELCEGLEEGVRKLLSGERSAELPWTRKD